MLKVPIDKILPVTEARANIARVVSDVERGDIYVLTRGGKPAAAVVPLDKVGDILEGNPTSSEISKPQNVKKEIAKVQEPENNIVIKSSKQTMPEKKEDEMQIPKGMDLSELDSRL